MELILIRHGTTPGNLEHRFIGVTDHPLAPEGEALARETAPKLPPVEHVYRSPLLRCEQTAAILWPGVAETVIPELRETDFGCFEGKNHEELKDDPVYIQYLSGGDYAKLPVGESAEEAAARAFEGLKKLVADAKERGLRRAGVVVHAGTIMGLLWTCGVPARPGYYDWMCGNCGGFRVAVRERPLALEVLDSL